MQESVLQLRLLRVLLQHLPAATATAVTAVAAPAPTVVVIPNLCCLCGRSVYFNFAYFMFFYNIFLGLISCLQRILKAMFVGIVFLSRLDNSTLPRRFEFFDPGEWWRWWWFRWCRFVGIVFLSRLVNGTLYGTFEFIDVGERKL